MADSKLTALTETSVPATDDVLYTVDVSDTTDDAAGSSRKLTLSRLLGLAGNAPGGRLTTESGVGVSTSDRTSQSTLYYTPFASDYVRLYDGTRVKEYTFTERSLALSGLTSGKNYDVFLYDNAGTLTLELSAAWTTDTARADALAWQAGVGYVKSGTATRLWLGTIRTTGTTATADSGAPAAGTTPKRFVWNAHNRVPRPLRAVEDASSWSYGTATWRSANNDATNRVEFVIGAVDVAVQADLTTQVYTGSAGPSPSVALALDSTTTPAGAFTQGYGDSVSATHAYYAGYPGLGYHYLQWIEISRSGTGTFYGTNTASECQSAVHAVLEG